MKKTLPFFAYGFFKPGELAYYKIANIVENHHPARVKGALFDKDGLPILVDQGSCKEHNDSIPGSVIVFKKGKEEEGYRRVFTIEPDTLYRWTDIETEDGTKVNVLVANPRVLEIIVDEEKRGHSVRGGTEFKRRKMWEFESPEDGPEWHGYQDTLFNEGMCYLKKFIQEAQNEEPENMVCASEEELRRYHRLTPELIKLFKEQMAYMFLWSIIERHNTMKYNIDIQNKMPKQREEFAADKLFKDAVKKFVPIADRRHMIVVNSSSERTVRVNDSDRHNSSYESIIKYYYQIRCNVVHRGKAGIDMKDGKLIKKALSQLYSIMEYMLSKEFPKPKKDV